MLSVEKICEALARLNDCANTGELSNDEMDKLQELHHELSALKSRINGKSVNIPEALVIR